MGVRYACGMPARPRARGQCRWTLRLAADPVFRVFRACQLLPSFFGIVLVFCLTATGVIDFVTIYNNNRDSNA